MPSNPFRELFDAADADEQELTFLLTGGLRIRGTINKEDLSPGVFVKVWPLSASGRPTYPVVVQSDHIIAVVNGSYEHLLPQATP